MSKQATTLCRRTVYYSGTVQGVCFRYTTQRTASGFRVTGFVRNLPDGRVEMVAEGTSAELDRFQQAVAEAMEGYISNVDATDDKPTGQFDAFTIAP